MKADIIIIGRGIVGSSIAYLSQLVAAGMVLVLERDHTYTHAATPPANGGIRRLFSLPENIQMAISACRSISGSPRICGLKVIVPISDSGDRVSFSFDNGSAAQMEENYRIQAIDWCTGHAFEPD